MAELSLCMIVKNEEHNLAYCLDCVSGIADEINIVDTGSTDKTIEIAKRYTDRIFYFKWIDDFAEARNFSYSKATKDFIIWLDADDILTQENKEKLLIVKKELADIVDYVIMQYRIHYNEDGSPSMIFPKARITRRAKNIKWYNAVHESLGVFGNGLTAPVYIDHKYKNHIPSSERDMRILRKEIISGRAGYAVYYFYALANYYNNNLEDAERYFQKVIDLCPPGAIDPIDIYLGMHNIYKARGSFDKARAILEDNERLLSDKSEYYCCLGEFYKGIYNDLNKACDMYKQALRCKGTFIRKDLPGQRNPDYYYYVPNMLLGKAYISLKEPESALVYFKRALSYKKNDEIEQIVKKITRLENLRGLEFAKIMNL